MRVVGLDIHRSFAEAAMLDEGQVRQLGRIDLVRERVVAFAKRLGKQTEVVVEATGNTMSVVKLMAPHVKRMVIANPLQVRAIAHAKVKTDKIDAVVLAKLHAAGFLPEVWQPDDATERLRRQVARRATIVHSRTRVKNRIQSVLHANLILPYKGDLFSGKGRTWLRSSHSIATSVRQSTVGSPNWTVLRRTSPKSMRAWRILGLATNACDG
jgi:transposase